MAAFKFQRRRTRRGWYVGATLVVAALFAVFYVAGASATLSGSPYDGSDGTLDTVAGITAAPDDPPGSTDNAFGQGSKEDSAAVTVVTGSIPPNKNDLSNFYEGSTVTSSGDFLYLGWTRLVNIGNANLDFEINKNATTGFNGSTTGALTLNRTAGDVLVTYDFSGSGTPTLGLNRWITSATVPVVTGFSTNTCLSANSFPCWGDHVTPGGTNSEASVSTNGLFGEAVINLTGTGVIGSGTCEFGQATTFLKSRSSSSFTAEIKDFIAPISTPLNPCASITIIKHTLNGASARGVAQDFGYTTTGTGLSGFTLNDSAGTDNTTNTKTFTGLGPGSYSVTETLPVTNFAFNDLTCTASGTGTSVSPSANPGGNSTPTASITLDFAGQVTCTYTNQQQLGAIEVTKTGKDKRCTAAGFRGTTADASCVSAGVRRLSGATFQLKKGSTVIGNMTETSTAGVYCTDGLVFGTDYTVQETGAPTAYSIDTTGVSSNKTINANGTCSTGTQTDAGTYTDSPLTTLEVIATGEAAAGATKSTISCTHVVSGSDVTVGTSITTPADPADWKTQHLKPDTYTCTVVIDP